MLRSTSVAIYKLRQLDWPMLFTKTRVGEQTQDLVLDFMGIIISSYDRQHEGFCRGLACQSFFIRICDTSVT